MQGAQGSNSLLSCPSRFLRLENFPSPSAKELGLQSKTPRLPTLPFCPFCPQVAWSLTQEEPRWLGDTEGSCSEENLTFTVKPTWSESWLRLFLVWELGQAMVSKPQFPHLR